MSDFASALVDEYLQTFRHDYLVDKGMTLKENPGVIELSMINEFPFCSRNFITKFVNSAIQKTNTTTYGVTLSKNQVKIYTEPNTVTPKFRVVKQNSATDISIEEMFCLGKQFTLQLTEFLIEEQIPASVTTSFDDFTKVKVRADHVIHNQVVNAAKAAAEHVGTRLFKVRTTKSTIEFTVIDYSTVWNYVLLDTRSNVVKLTIPQIANLLSSRFARIDCTIEVRDMASVDERIMVYSDTTKQSVLMQVITDVVVEHQIPVKVVQDGQHINIDVKQFLLF